MKHTPQGTTIESGDPHFISFVIGNCPVCGKPLMDDPGKLYTQAGHLKSVFECMNMKGVVSFAACVEHFEEAQSIPTRMPHKESLGYKGQWEPRFGLLAQVCRVDKPDTYIRLV